MKIINMESITICKCSCQYIPLYMYAVSFCIKLNRCDHVICVLINGTDQCGLEPGDQVLEVNSVSFENIASSSAVKVLTGTLRLKMTIRRIGKIPGFKFAQEKTSWYVVSE